MHRDEEGRYIEAYKDYAARHFGNGANMERYRAVHFDPDAYPEQQPDTLGALEVYLRHLRKLSKHLTRAAQLRQEHYEQFISGKREEEKGHQLYREAMNQLAADAQGKLLIWERARDQQLDEAIARWNALPTPPAVVKAGRVPKPQGEVAETKSLPDIQTVWKVQKPMPMSKEQRRRRDEEVLAEFGELIKEDYRRCSEAFNKAVDYKQLWGSDRLPFSEAITPLGFWSSIAPLLPLIGKEHVDFWTKKYQFVCPTPQQMMREVCHMIVYMILFVENVSSSDLSMHIYTEFITTVLSSIILGTIDPPELCKAVFKQVVRELSPPNLKLSLSTRQVVIFNVIASFLVGMDAVSIMKKDHTFCNTATYKQSVKRFFIDRVYELDISMQYLLRTLETMPAFVPSELFMYTFGIRRFVDFNFSYEVRLARKGNMGKPDDAHLGMLKRMHKQVKIRCGRKNA